MTERDRIMRLERIVMGDGVDEPGMLTRLATIQQLLETHVASTALPTRSTLAALVIGAVISAGIGWIASATQPARAAITSHQ